MTQLLRSESDGIVTLTLNRPEARNALSIELCDRINDTLAEPGSRDARAIVLQGAGKIFCAGADFAAVTSGAADFVVSFERMLESVARHPSPVIASIKGAALGGGFQLATVCDFRVAASDAKLGIPSTSLGIVVNYENVERLVLLAGPALAKEVLMAGSILSGEQGAGAGLVTKSVPVDSLEAETSALATGIAGLAPLSVRGAKAAIQATLDHLAGARRALPERTSEVDRLVAEAYASADLQEGLAARAERRPPRFTGH